MNHDPKRSGLVTLLTDFGLDDPFVGIMKGVLLGRCPDARIVDLTHGIAPGDERAASLALASAFPHFPPGTVHVVVVDPGVGTSRRILVAEANGQIFLAPDSGIVPGALDPFGEGAAGAGTRFRRLDDPRLYRRPISATFHGRDVFAPVAAALAGGWPLEDLGPPLDDPLTMTLPAPLRDGDALAGEVIHVDRFGNLVTNVREQDLFPGPFTALVKGRDIPGPARAYGDTEPGRLLAIPGSAGFLEIAVREGRADRQLDAGVGTEVVLKPADERSQTA